MDGDDAETRESGVKQKRLVEEKRGRMTETARERERGRGERGAGGEGGGSD